MALRLEIISSHRQQLGPRASIVLGVAGGSVGRALDNDWALPDSNRFLSGHHARFHFRAGHYVVEDTSSNGVFVNDASKPLGKRGIHRLHAGDVLRLGEYRMLVHIDEDDAAALPAPGASTMANLVVQNVVPLRIPGSQRRNAARPDDDLGHALDIASLFPEGSAAGVAEPAPPHAQPVNDLAHTAAPVAPSAPAAASPPSSMQDRLQRLRAAAKARLEGTSPAQGLQSGMQAFCRGAGLEIEKLPFTSDAQSLQLMGRLLRESLLGLKEILRAQGEFRRHYGISEEKPEAPSLAELGSDEYLLALLAGHDQRRLDAVMRLRDQFAEVARHELAVDPAFGAALTQFVSHLDPARMDGLSADLAWARYRDVYANLLRAQGGEVPHLFVEALLQAYLKESEPHS